MNDIEQFQEFHRYLASLKGMGYEYDAAYSDQDNIAFKDKDKRRMFFGSVDEMKGYIDGYLSRGQQMRIGIDEIKKIVERGQIVKKVDALNSQTIRVGSDFLVIDTSGSDDDFYEKFCQTLLDGLNCPF